MNAIRGIVNRVDETKNMSIIEMNYKDQMVTSIILESLDKNIYVKVGKEICLVFKETELALAKNFKGVLSFRNQFDSRVMKIKKGKLLSEVSLDFKGTKLSSIITTNSFNKLKLEVGDNVKALIKANEISVMYS